MQTDPLSTPEAWNLVAEGYVTELQPMFERYALDALALANPPAGARVLDVATGPGTLALAAIEAGCRVTAVDFSEGMLEQLRQACALRGISDIEIRHGDGQALEFADGTFDYAFSMFGLMFFPDRAAGFRELRRVLRPGGRAVIASWAPRTEVPLLDAFEAALRQQAPTPSSPATALPLSDPEVVRGEMSSAGFAQVEVHRVAHEAEVPSVAAFWESNQSSSARVALLRQAVEPTEWERISARACARVEAELGPGPHILRMPAFLTIGTR
ncbi:MAG TPA: methyltransferase domain-containing protein [Longimicrobiaceae bacterium]